jgi:hypothetical protein
MSDPRRWIDPQGGASDEVRALLSAGHAAPGLPPGVREAGARYVASLPKAAAVTTATGAKALVLLGSVSAVVAMGVALSRPPKAAPTAPSAPTHVAHVASPPRNAVAAVPPPSEPAPVAPPVTARAPEAPRPAEAPRFARLTTPPVARPRTTPVSTAPTLRARPASTASVATLETEEARLREATRRLEDAPAQSLAIARTLAAEPHRVLVEEREYIQFRALERLGERAEARRVGEAFVARWPESIYADAVRSHLAAAH